MRWRLAGDNLERVWVVLDRDIDSEPRVQRVLDNVRGLQLRYLDEEAVWHEEWPPFDFGRGSRRMPPNACRSPWS